MKNMKTIDILPWQIKRSYLEKGVILSTIRPIALAWYGEYETAITFDNQKNWKILKGYDNKEEAIEWHEKFKNMSIEELMNMRGL